MRERINMRRVIPILCIALSTFLLSGLFCYMQSLYPDEIICVAFIDIIFLSLAIFELEFDRKRRYISNNSKTTFGRVAIGYMACCVIAYAFWFQQSYCKPVIVFSFILYAVGNEMLAFFMGIYLVVLLGMIQTGDFNELVLYILLLSLGVVIARAMENTKLKYSLFVNTFCVSAILPNLFYYFANKEINNNIIFYSLINGAIAVVFAFITCKFIIPASKAECENCTYDIISEDYIQVKELKAYSKFEYEHALRVSDIAYRCAKAAGLDMNLCAAAGFYYRIGKWEGEPHVEKGILKAEELCFPEKVIQIISEYYGEEERPSTPESALVHIVDALVIKLEKMKEDVGLSQWNREMIIYQTLNEFSSSGIYDHSGLGMNQFLVIREYLTKEEMLR